MNTYCLRHTPVTIGLGLGMLLAGVLGMLCPANMDPLGGASGGIGVFLFLGSLLVAVWPNVPRLRIETDAFGVRGFLGRSLTFDEYPWETLLAVESDGPSSDAGFVVVTAKSRVRIRANTAGLSEVRRLFEKIAGNPDGAAAILADDYCEDEAPIELRKNWQMGIGPTLMIPGCICLWASGAWGRTLFGLLFLGAAWTLFVVYMYQFLRNPYSIRLEGTMLTVAGPIRKRQWDLMDMSAMDLLEGDDSERVRIRTSDGKTTDIRLKDFFGYPVFDRAFYSIRCRWTKTRAALGTRESGIGGSHSKSVG